MPFLTVQQLLWMLVLECKSYRDCHSMPTNFSTCVTPTHPLRCVIPGPQLGAGSFGAVFQGIWRGRVVAVKVIAHDRQSSKNIKNEAAVSMSALHPNVVRTFHHFSMANTDTAGCSPSGREVCRLQGGSVL